MRSGSQGCSRLRRNYLGFLAPFPAVDTLIVRSCCDSLSPRCTLSHEYWWVGQFFSPSPALNLPRLPARNHREGPPASQDELDGALPVCRRSRQGGCAQNYTRAKVRSQWIIYAPPSLRRHVHHGMALQGAGGKVGPEHDFKLLLQAGAPQAAVGEISGFNWT